MCRHSAWLGRGCQTIDAIFIDRHRSLFNNHSSKLKMLAMLIFSYLIISVLEYWLGARPFTEGRRMALT
jgi:hypothetical protein